MKLDSRKKYNLKWAKNKLKEDKKNAKDMLKIFTKQKKEIENGLSFLNFETECHQKYGEEYTYNQNEKNIMLKNYECKKHFEFLLNKYSKKIEDEIKVINRNINFYIDENYNFTYNNYSNEEKKILEV